MMYNTPENASSSNYPTNPSISYPFTNYQHHSIMIPVPSPPPPLPPFSGGGGGGADDDEFPRRDERFPQWSNQETRDFIEIRAQLEWDFNSVKRNKNLWEMVTNRMREKGYRRTIDQCKCKWKNLVNRYKGLQVSDLDNGQQCPFFDELHAVFTARASRQQQAQLESANASIKGQNKRKSVSEFQSLEDFSAEEQDDEEGTEINPYGQGPSAPKKKTVMEKRQKIEKHLKKPVTNVNTNDGIISLVRDMLGNFIQQQQWIDMQWKETIERREQEREMFEQEWRQTMEKLERERLTMEQAWREREEQRRLREESRAEKRDALLTALMNKLIREDNNA